MVLLTFRLMISSQESNFHFQRMVTISVTLFFCLNPVTCSKMSLSHGSHTVVGVFDVLTCLLLRFGNVNCYRLCMDGWILSLSDTCMR